MVRTTQLLAMLIPSTHVPKCPRISKCCHTQPVIQIKRKAVNRKRRKLRNSLLPKRRCAEIPSQKGRAVVRPGRAQSSLRRRSMSFARDSARRGQREWGSSECFRPSGFQAWGLGVFGSMAPESAACVMVSIWLVAMRIHSSFCPCIHPFVIPVVHRFLPIH